MKTAVRNTSVQSYHQLENKGKKQNAILEYLERVGSACNLDISDDLNWPINTVTPRTNELLKADLIQEDRRDICPKTDRKVIYWRLKLAEPVQTSLI